MHFVVSGADGEQVAVHLGVARYCLPIDIILQRLRDGYAVLGHVLHIGGKARMFAHVAFVDGRTAATRHRAVQEYCDKVWPTPGAGGGVITSIAKIGCEGQATPNDTTLSTRLSHLQKHIENAYHKPIICI